MTTGGTTGGTTDRTADPTQGPGAPAEPMRERPDAPFVEPVSVRPLALAPLLGVLVFGYLGYRSSNPWLMLLACAAGGPFVVSWFGRPRLEHADLRSTMPARAAVGEQVFLVVQLENRGRRPLPGLVLTHRAAGFDDETVVVDTVPPGVKVVVTRRRTARHRALSFGSEIVLTTSAPFGMVERRRVLRDERVTAVHPVLGPPADVVLLGGAGDDPANAPARTGPDLHSVREWRPGDETRRVHWRATARHGRLVVAEPERTVTRRLAVVVAGQRTAGPTWEALLSRVAGTVVEAARADRELLLLVRDARAAALWPAEERGWTEDAGLAAVEGRDAAELLDALAAVDDVALPTGGDLRRAAEWAGAGGDVLVATTHPFEPNWWRAVSARVADLGVRLGQLG